MVVLFWAGNALGLTLQPSTAALLGATGVLAGALGGQFPLERFWHPARQFAGNRIGFLDFRIGDRTQIDARMEFAVHFPAGDDHLPDGDNRQMDMLASYLTRDPELRVRLDGYADPCGSDEYNNVLSQFRTLAVASALYQRGISPERIDLYFHGAVAAARPGDSDYYARERRVSIQVYQLATEALAA